MGEILPRQEKALENKIAEKARGDYTDLDALDAEITLINGTLTRQLSEPPGQWPYAPGTKKVLEQN